MHVSVKRRALVMLFGRLQAMGLRILPESGMKVHHRDMASLFQSDWSLSGVGTLLSKGNCTARKLIRLEAQALCLDRPHPFFRCHTTAQTFFFVAHSVVSGGDTADPAGAASRYLMRCVLGMQHLRLAAIRSCHQVPPPSPVLKLQRLLF